jgi:hypothetical protein
LWHHSLFFDLAMKHVIRFITLLSLLNTSACILPQSVKPEKPQEGTVKGKVTDKYGNPVANAEIVASSTDWHNQTSTGYTDANGNYSFQLPTGVAAGSYTASGTVTVKYHNKNFVMPLYEKNSKVFSAYEGAVRDFSFRLTGLRKADENDPNGLLGATLEVHHDFDAVNAEDIEITLDPVGPLVDGSTGDKLVSMLPAQDYRIRDIPVGNYKITARNKSTGEKLGVTIQGSLKSYAPSITSVFEPADFIGSGFFELVIVVGKL